MIGLREILHETFRGHVSNSPYAILVVHVISEGVCDPKVPKACLAVLGNQDIPLNTQNVNP